MSALIIGSGPAAAGAALALSTRGRQQITVVDIGGRLEDERQSLLEKIASVSREAWDPQAVQVLAERAPLASKGALPEKRSYGSDFPFADLGQRRGITAEQGANEAVVSSAYGGFSNVWGAQVMPFSRATFDRWPISYDEMEPHYRAVLERIPFAGEDDDLAEHFPLIAKPRPLPALSPRTAMVLGAYGRHRASLRELGVTVGHARLALAADPCVRCGLCMTGCPYSLIYSASQTFDRLRASGAVEYHDGLLVHAVGERDGQAVLNGTRLASGERVELHADRLFVAAGGIGTTQIVLNSIGGRQRVTLGESVQFGLPMVSLRPAPDPRMIDSFTLNQFNIVVSFDDEAYRVAQLHLYPYNPSMQDALPTVMRTGASEPLRRALFRRLSIALGYLPSWESPRVAVESRATSNDGFGTLSVSREGGGRPQMLDEVLAKLRRAAPHLDLWPVSQQMFVSKGAKSYHFGGSFPHQHLDSRDEFGTDRLGRLSRWTRIHLIDGSVFPSVPSTTFTLTAMANAHRIASESMSLPHVEA
jgi:ferredoxin